MLASSMPCGRVVGDGELYRDGGCGRRVSRHAGSWATLAKATSSRLFGGWDAAHAGRVLCEGQEDTRWCWWYSARLKGSVCWKRRPTGQRTLEHSQEVVAEVLSNGR